MARFPKPSEGSLTEHYPELGTGPVSYEDSTSPEIYELEREAIFKRAWLNVGRVEQIPRKGSYLTRELKVANTSIILVRTASGEIKAYHNVCRHRGNKLVEQHAARGVQRRVSPVHLQVPRLALRPGRQADVRATGGGVLRSRQGPLRAGVGALRRLGGLHLRQPREKARTVAARVFGADGTGSGGLPLRQADLAVVIPLGGEGELEAVHGRFSGVLRRAGTAREPVADRLFKGGRRGRFRGPALPCGRSAPTGQHVGGAG